MTCDARWLADDSATTLACSGFGEVDPDPAAAAENPVGADSFGAQRSYRRLADSVRRQPGDVLALDSELRQADGNVRLTAAERCAEHR